MRSSLLQFSEFVSELNTRARYHDALDLADWGINHLAETIGFDCAWYGWAQLMPDDVHIHEQCTLNLPVSFYQSWYAMSKQDLLAAAMREKPEQTAVYDRKGKFQTDGMISLADQYGLSKMATAMHLRSDRNTSFYVSSYRGGRQARAWCEDELEYLQCGVNQISAAMRLSAAEMQMPMSGREHSMIVTNGGIVIFGLARAFEKWGSLWPEWRDEQLPEHLRNLISIPGEHILVDRQLVVSCESAHGVNGMNLRKLTLRSLTKFDLLTRREQQVAELLADGNSHKQAARLLGVAPATVRNQTQSIYSKMGVNRRAELALQVRSSSKLRGTLPT